MPRHGTIRFAFGCAASSYNRVDLPSVSTAYMGGEMRAAKIEATTAPEKLYRD